MKRKLFLFSFILLGTFSFSQSSELETKFLSMEVSDKIKLYETISDSLRRANSAFLKKEFEKVSELKTTYYEEILIAVILAEINRNEGKYIESANILRTLLSEGNVAMKDSVHILDHLNKTYYSLGLYSEVFETNSKISDLIDKGAYYPPWAYNINSKFYAKLNQYDKAANALKLEINKLRENKIKDSLIIPSGYNDLGYYYLQANKIDTALFYFKKSLVVASKFLSNAPKSKDRIIGLVHGNIGEVFIAKNEYEKAIPLLKDEIKYSLKHNQNKDNLIKAYCLLAKAYINVSIKEKEVKTIFKNIEKLLKTNPSNKNSILFCKQKVAFFRMKKQIDSANYWLNETLKTHNAIEELNKKKIIKTNELILEINKKNKEIESFKIEVKNNELLQKSKQQKRMFIFLFVLIILLLISIYGVYRIKKDKKILVGKNKEIKIKNEEIKEALFEKEILLKEVHHRVKNNLQIISGLLELQNIKVDNQDIKIALEEGKNRIQSVALIHKMMYQSETVSKVKMKDYLEELIAMLKVSYENPLKPIDISVKTDEINIDITKAVPISLIVNELICNAYKYAFNDKNGNEIKVILKNGNQEKDYLLEISDNGIGLPENFNFENSKTIGFDLIKGLTRQLKGNVKVENTKGLTVQIQF